MHQPIVIAAPAAFISESNGKRSGKTFKTFLYEKPTHSLRRIIFARLDYSFSGVKLLLIAAVQVVDHRTKKQN